MHDLTLVSVHRARTKAVPVLYQLLKERPEYARISHKKMPTLNEHEKFVRSHPFYEWYLIRKSNCYVGELQVTRLNEIGISILKRYQGQGFAEAALKLFVESHQPLHDKPAVRVKAWLANVAPDNEDSKKFFSRMGFVKVQETFRLDVV